MSEPVIQEIKSRWRGIRPFERHSLLLMVAGTVYILIGMAYYLAEPTATRVQALEFALRWIDYNHWGLVFMFVGVLAIISSRWPPVSETWGYTLLTGQSAAWALFYAAGVVFGTSPTSNLSSVLTWGLIGFMWWIISGLVNPRVLKKLLAEMASLRHENLQLHAELRKLRQKEG